ncbi:MAG TPA: hypothetical protein VGC13_18620 [Longimicrobium sp.]|jgi:hypothetical protein|uniref:hypothetical protein n=1 Tax=Longimicrobium sp. TaxID=2029185 RepID=UPI002ED8942C
MKKLRLKLADLEITSFTAQEKEAPGSTVYANQLTTICSTQYPICTQADGCYPSLYCSQDSPELTCAMGCMTNENGYC